MSVSPLAYLTPWVDGWGVWDAYAEVWLEAAEYAKCHACRLALIPSQDKQIIPADGIQHYTFTLVPGSMIVGLWVDPLAANVIVQVKDVATQHEWFQDPINMNLLQTTGFTNGRFPSVTLLPRAYPVVGEGLFDLTLWGTPGARHYMILLVAEVTGCPVK
jgi:hypothetical protein